MLFLLVSHRFQTIYYAILVKLYSEYTEYLLLKLIFVCKYKISFVFAVKDWTQKAKAFIKKTFIFCSVLHLKPSFVDCGCVSSLWNLALINSDNMYSNTKTFFVFVDTNCGLAQHTSFKLDRNWIKVTRIVLVCFFHNQLWFCTNKSSVHRIRCENTHSFHQLMMADSPSPLCHFMILLYPASRLSDS